MAACCFPSGTLTTPSASLSYDGPRVRFPFNSVSYKVCDPDDPLLFSSSAPRLPSLFAMNKPKAVSFCLSIIAGTAFLWARSWMGAQKAEVISTWSMGAYSKLILSKLRWLKIRTEVCGVENSLWRWKSKIWSRALLNYLDSSSHLSQRLTVMIRVIRLFGISG